jgi:FKBP-type peptidyl-prolyl cis-trans isomerase 2
MAFGPSGCATPGSGKPGQATPGTAQTGPAPAVEKDVIAAGDLVGVDYKLRLEEGGPLIFSTRRDIAEDPDLDKVDWFMKTDQYGPEWVVAGDDSSLPELSKGVVGLKPGSQTTIILPPEKGFGRSDPKKIMKFPLVKVIPRKSFITPKDYVARFGTFPVAGQQVRNTPYFESDILEVSENYVTLQCLVKEGRTEKENSFGLTVIDVDEKNVTITLVPTIGAQFEMAGNKGRIVDADKTDVSVDFNHPAAGRPLAMEMTVVSVEKASRFAGRHLTWIEDHDDGFALAAEEKKPMVMVLYAGWCGWSEKMLNDTIGDPRIQKMWDQFIWVKVDSDEHQEYKARYEQSGFPMTVLTNASGGVLKKLDGFRDARSFRRELDGILKQTERDPSAS